MRNEKTQKIITPLRYFHIRKARSPPSFFHHRFDPMEYFLYTTFSTRFTLPHKHFSQKHLFLLHIWLYPKHCLLSDFFTLQLK